jgi:hypothetical protein
VGVSVRVAVLDGLGEGVGVELGEGVGVELGGGVGVELGEAVKVGVWEGGLALGVRVGVSGAGVFVGVGGFGVRPVSAGEGEVVSVDCGKKALGSWVIVGFARPPLHAKTAKVRMMTRPNSPQPVALVKIVNGPHRRLFPSLIACTA